MAPSSQASSQRRRPAANPSDRTTGVDTSPRSPGQGRRYSPPGPNIHTGRGALAQTRCDMVGSFHGVRRSTASRLGRCPGQVPAWRDGQSVRGLLSRGAYPNATRTSRGKSGNPGDSRAMPGLPITARGAWNGATRLVDRKEPARVSDNEWDWGLLDTSVWVGFASSGVRPGRIDGKEGVK